MSGAYLLSAARTPIGGFRGVLAQRTAPELGAVALRTAVERAHVPAEDVELVVMGNVIAAGLGQAPARQAGLGAGLPHTHGALTVNKVCGSGLMAIALAAQSIRLGEADIVAAGGMESMSRAPYLVPRARDGQRLGHGALLDAMILDGLWDPYDDFHMGSAAERCARERAIDREAQDAYAAESYRRAQAAVAAGAFADEIVPVDVPDRGGVAVVRKDEEPSRVDFDRIAALRPSFERDGTITAANASTLADGAAALVVASEAAIRRYGIVPRARIVATAVAGRAPAEFPIAPIDAVRKVVDGAGLRLADIDLFEINEAFAVVALAAVRALDLDPAAVNVRGGAIALGHPIGASGARILTTLLGALDERRARFGLATLCLGGGEAIAMIVERQR
ncbi:MAG: acetyl-CoA acetyltransferase [Polyangiaceae bacterium UTPRO1]|jgi:acetyl-CoA C-acetyltransferase|nr:thiolase family protein [Myxococcales bacterium]OQY67449.1 MAG: acetyl-CoA acetyltransferase [Polyangiaceae bacterium UTPRO1]